jgi:uncharacterized MAPEG superfamily protein
MMTSPGSLLVAIVVGAVLVYLPFLVVGYARFKVGYDMSAPRAMFDKLPPYAQRAAWAHQNGFESFALFAPAALMAYATGQSSQVAVGAALVYLAGRTLYPVFYILDVPLLRSLMFALGSLGTFTLFVVSCRSVLM